MAVPLQALADPQTWLAFLTLVALEVVLGVDNIIVLSVLVARLPPERRRAARITGLALAMLMRLALLCSVVWLTHLTAPLCTVAGLALSGRDLVLLVGGLFLLLKTAQELHRHRARAVAAGKPRADAGFTAIIVQVAVLDLVFSLDSVFAAVGLSRQLFVMMAAIITAVLVMMWVAGVVGAFIDRNPAIKPLALVLLLLIGAALVAGGLHHTVPPPYLYGAMGVVVVVGLARQALLRRRLLR